MELSVGTLIGQALAFLLLLGLTLGVLIGLMLVVALTVRRFRKRTAGAADSSDEESAEASKP